MKNENTITHSEVKMYNYHENLTVELSKLQAETDKWRKMTMLLLFVLFAIVMCIASNNLNQYYL